ncbi:MAG TPA: DUF998 domain-containing protein [Vicinamibacteria bacterium]|jgi:hypothetical protein
MSAERGNAATRSLLLAGVIGAFGFLAVALAAGAVRPDYSALHVPVSLLSRGPGGWVQVANFVVTGVLMVACAVGLRRGLHAGPGDRWGPYLVATYGVGLAGAGVFPADPSFAYPPGAALGPATSPSVPGMMHEIASVLVFGALSAACFVFARRFGARPGDRRWRTYCIATGLAVPAFLAGAFFAWTRGTPLNFGGVLQRMSIAAGWGWIALLALRIRRETPATSP